MAEYYAGRGTTAMSIIGTALGGLSVLGGGMGLLTNGQNAPQYATKDDVNNAITISSKQSEIDMLKSEQRENEKIIETYKEIIQRVNADKAEQAAINQQQAVYNCACNSNINLLQNQVAQLMGMTALHIPSTNICPEPMARYNSWTAPVAAAAPTT